MRATISLVIAGTSLLAAFLAAIASPDPQVRNALLALCILCGFVFLALLLPDFDGRREEDWDSYRWPHS